MLMGAPSQERRAAGSSRADCASVSRLISTPTVGSTGRGSVKCEHEGGKGRVG